MHILNGNHGPARSWYQQHSHKCDAFFSIATLNIGGLQEAVKRTRSKNLNKDILVLIETHLQSHLEHSENHQFKDYYCFWGTNPADKHFSGIGILIKRSKFWSAQQIVWPSDHPCYKFSQESRLVATQVWFARGGTSLVVYGIYRVSGARWDRVKKTYTHELIQAVQYDQISRGQLPCVIMADFNLELQDSQNIRQLLQQKFWYDLRSRGKESEAMKATCHKSSGSLIDRIFVSPSLIDQSFEFQIHKLPEFKDDSLVAANISCPSPMQTRTSLRSVAPLPSLRSATPENVNITGCLGNAFDDALRTQDVNLAFKLWTQEFERILFKIAEVQGCAIPATAAAKRGQIIFHEQRKHPKVVFQQASTLKGRKLWKAHCQIQEVLRASHGTRKDGTIKNLWSVLPWLSPQHAESFEQSLSSSKFEQVAVTLKNALEANDREDRQQRILKWKRSLRKDLSASYQHLRRKAASAPAQVSTVQGQATANIKDRLASIEAVWKKIYSMHKNGEPTFRRFMEIYRPFLKTSPSNCGSLHEKVVSKALQQMKASSPGLDHILTSELQVAVSWCPILLHHLTRLLQVIKNSHKWPTCLTKGVVAFIPKEPEKDAPLPLPDEFRPITVLICVYRLWASARHLQVAHDWYPKWQHSRSFGGKGAPSADQLALQTCFQLSEMFVQGGTAAGLSFDLRKCFDTIPYGLALDLFLMCGCNPEIVQTLRNFYSQHKKYFRLDGHHSPPFQPSCGIIQGCPLSMLILISLVTSWLEYNDAKIPTAVSRAYADDMSSVVAGPSNAVVKDDVRQVYQNTHLFTSVSGMQINTKKTFTFKNAVPQVQDHQTTFRLVGCSIKISHQPMWTPRYSHSH